MQHTITRPYTFTGKGLHTGVVARMTLRPAEAGSGIQFCRTDIGPDAIIPALATFVSGTDHGTTITCEVASVSTIEHLMSAAAGLGIDNMLVEIDGPEVPILDGSAAPYVDVIAADGMLEQPTPRKELSLRKPFHWEDPSGATIDILPQEEFAAELTVDFNSKVLGVQRFRYDKSVDYATGLPRAAHSASSTSLSIWQAKGSSRVETPTTPSS